MTEPDVILTDYLITLISLYFIWDIYLHSITRDFFTKTWLLFFFTIAVSSFLGGTVHGFCSNPMTLCQTILWPTTLLSIGLTAVCCWIIGGYFLFKKNIMQKWMAFIACLYVIYAIVVIFYIQKFFIAIISYLPAILFLFIANLMVFVKTKSSSCLWVMSGIITSFVAAYIQQAGVALNSEYFNHNATYHIVQIIGLCLLFKGARQQILSRRVYQ